MNETLIQKINNRRLIEGPQDRAMCISPLKHPWAMEAFKRFRRNDWYPESIAMGDDVACYRNRLDDGERRMYDKALAFVSNLDGFQFENLTTNIGAHITSPEVSMAISRQAYEEANHVTAYQLMTEAISARPLDIYGMYESDPILAAKNKLILDQNDELRGGFTPEKFALAIVGNVNLEGIYFYSGFFGFYLLARAGKMLKSADQIKYINRDEEAHLGFFIDMYHCLKAERPEIFTPAFYEKAKNMMRAAVELEKAWGKHIISGGVLGATDTIVDQRIEWLANTRAARLGWEPLYPGVVNPTPWVEKISAINGVETNFFEGKPTDYQAGGALDFDDL
jgi:ribonucleoside-diphosphate reductase beta chain